MIARYQLGDLTLLAQEVVSWRLAYGERIRRLSFQAFSPASCLRAAPHPHQKRPKAELKHSPGQVTSLCLLVYSFYPAILLRLLEYIYTVLALRADLLLCDPP